ncbi:MAG: transcriptional regulator, partial [Marinilabiliales bacterium]
MNELRKTTQFLIPEQVQATEAGNYDIYPGFKVADGAIKIGYPELAAYIKQHKTVVIDGFEGVFWKEIVYNISAILKKDNLQALWYNTSAAMKDGEDIDEMIAPFLGGDDPIFGTRTTLSLKDFFHVNHLQRIHPDQDADINILYGPGAALCGWEAPIIYVDLPKNELQFRMRAGKTYNLGATQHYSNKAMYKRFYFVDWVVLNRHKQELSDKIDIIVDSQRPETPFWTTGETLRKSLKQMSENYFRVRPWFEPGPWGGHFMKKHFPQLNPDVPNYAWSFELIVPENGLLLEDNGKMLEVSFDFLMYLESKNVLGDAAERFGVEFPIRFDYLDTFDGGNLSVQVHPQQ